MSFVNHCWSVIRRLVRMRLDEKIISDGMRIMIITIGNPIIVGAAKEVNRFSFILVLKVMEIVLWLF